MEAAAGASASPEVRAAAEAVVGARRKRAWAAGNAAESARSAALAAWPSSATMNICGAACDVPAGSAGQGGNTTAQAWSGCEAAYSTRGDLLTGTTASLECIRSLWRCLLPQSTSAQGLIGMCDLGNGRHLRAVAGVGERFQRVGQAGVVR